MLCLGVIGLFTSCEKDLDQYSGTDYIRFIPDFTEDSLDYCFGLAGKTDVDRIGIEVKISGEVTAYDRDNCLRVNTASTAQEGVHFNIPEQNCKIRANHVTDTLWIEILNQPELKNKQVYLQLDLVENENFRLCFSDNNSCKVYLTDQVGWPEWWDEWHETDGLGKYSEKKYRLFIQVSGIADLGAVEYPEKREAILKFKYYLEEEADNGNVILDEDNRPMTVAMYG